MPQQIWRGRYGGPGWHRGSRGKQISRIGYGSHWWSHLGHRRSERSDASCRTRSGSHGCDCCGRRVRCKRSPRVRVYQAIWCGWRGRRRTAHAHGLCRARRDRGLHVVCWRAVWSHAIRDGHGRRESVPGLPPDIICCSICWNLQILSVPLHLSTVFSDLFTSISRIWCLSWSSAWYVLHRVSIWYNVHMIMIRHTLTRRWCSRSVFHAKSSTDIGLREAKGKMFSSKTTSREI
jgi:hypothetical protein